jgi:hypothetical protein
MLHKYNEPILPIIGNIEYTELGAYSGVLSADIVIPHLKHLMDVIPKLTLEPSIIDLVYKILKMYLFVNLKASVVIELNECCKLIIYRVDNNPAIPNNIVRVTNIDTGEFLGVTSLIKPDNELYFNSLSGFISNTTFNNDDVRIYTSGQKTFSINIQPDVIDTILNNLVLNHRFEHHSNLIH